MFLHHRGIIIIIVSLQKAIVGHKPFEMLLLSLTQLQKCRRRFCFRALGSAAIAVHIHNLTSLRPLWANIPYTVDFCCVPLSHRPGSNPQAAMTSSPWRKGYEKWRIFSMEFYICQDRKIFIIQFLSFICFSVPSFVVTVFFSSYGSVFTI